MIARIYGRWMPAADSSAGGKAEQAFGQMPSVSGVDSGINLSSS